MLRQKRRLATRAGEVAMASADELRRARIVLRCLGALAQDECRLSQGRREPIVVRTRLLSAQAVCAHLASDLACAREFILQYSDGGSVDSRVPDILQGPRCTRVLVGLVIDAEGGGEVLG